MIKSDDITREIIKQHNPNLTQILTYSCRILAYGGSVSGKKNVLRNLIS